MGILMRVLLVACLALSLGACGKADTVTGDQSGDTGGGDTGGDTGGGDTGGDTGGGDTGGGGDARACYNSNQGVIGTRVEMVLRSTDSASGLVLTTTSDTLVNRQTTFNGHDALEAVSDVDADASDDTYDSQSTTKSYYVTDDAHYALHAFGGITQTSSPFASTSTITLDPEMLNSLDLDEGGSYDQDYTVHTQSDIAPFPLPDAQVSSTRTDQGRESVTVPAGTFDTCKIREEATNTINGQSSNAVSTSWYAVDTGVLVKNVAGTTTSELISAAINGQPVK
jgi:hypothetical protein